MFKVQSLNCLKIISKSANQQISKLTNCYIKIKTPDSKKNREFLFYRSLRLNYHCFPWDGDIIGTVRIGLYRRWGIPGQIIGGQVYIGAHGFVPFYYLPGIGGHTANNGTHSTHCPIFCIAYHSFIPYGFKKFDMLYLIGIGIVFSTMGKYFPTAKIFYKGIVSKGFYGSLGALESLGYPTHGFWHMATLTSDNCTARIGIFHKVMVEDLTVIFPRPYLSPSHSLGRDWIFSNKPVGNVDIVDVLFQDMVPAQPIKIIPITHLVLQFGLPWLSFPYPDSPTVPIYLSGNNFSDLIVLDVF